VKKIPKFSGDGAQLTPRPRPINHVQIHRLVGRESLTTPHPVGAYGASIDPPPTSVMSGYGLYFIAEHGCHGRGEQ